MQAALPFLAPFARRSLLVPVVSLNQCLLPSGFSLRWAVKPPYRLASVGNSTTVAPADFGYALVNKSFTDFENADHADATAVVTSLFGAALLSPWSAKTFNLDPWSNVSRLLRTVTVLYPCIDEINRSKSRQSKISKVP